MTALAKRNLVITGEKRCPDRAVQERRSAATAVPGVQSAAVRRSAVPIDPVHFWLSPHAPDVAKESNQERVDREIPSFFLKSGRRPRRPSPSNSRERDISGNLPALIPDQVRKLKKLSVLTLAESTKQPINQNIQSFPLKY
uniref:Uncharacterized protein n=1 Tax=Oryza glumipatula TaxID=40148 RepID=A0A0E0AZE0_9ORYZ